MHVRQSELVRVFDRFADDVALDVPRKAAHLRVHPPLRAGKPDRIAVNDPQAQRCPPIAASSSRI